MNQYEYIYDAVVKHYDELDCKWCWRPAKYQRYRYVIDAYKESHKYTSAGFCHLLQGLLFDIEFYPHTIANLLATWGVEPTEKNIENYWRVLGNRMLILYSSSEAHVAKLLAR